MNQSLLTIFYRLSDKGNPKKRLNGLNNQTALRNFINEFPVSQIEIIADNVLDETYSWLKTFKFKKIHRTSLGNSASFWFAFEQALKIENNQFVYFVENDYLHKKDSMMVLLEGLQIADYVTLYDHPDKYINGINPKVKNGGEKSKVFLTPSVHWKVTNSTTMTFAAKTNVLKKDKLFFKLFSIGLVQSKLPLLKKFSGGPNPRDYSLFNYLMFLKKRLLISPIPGYSTHGENEYLAPFTTWSDFIKE
mgnify:CR=1 FL=1